MAILSLDPNFGLDPCFRAVVVTGGPCAGKSTFLAKARQHLEDAGLVVATLRESATEVIMAGINPRKANCFQEHLLLYQLEREERYYSFLKGMLTYRHKVLLCDRGALDIGAYISEEEFGDILKRHDVDIHNLRERYSGVVHLVTAANSAEEHYTLENNPARSESLEEARNRDALTLQVWLGHRHHSLIDNSTGFEGKILRALKAMARVLHMPEPLEKERKFLVEDFDISRLPEDAVKICIEQTYLISHDGEERRVRRRTIDSGSSYYLTRKKATDNVGERIEVESQITREEYENLIARERDPETRVIKKHRHNFHYGSHIFELDIFEEPVVDLVLLEVEVQDMSEDILLPENLGHLVEVTGNESFSNYFIAKSVTSL